MASEDPIRNEGHTGDSPNPEGKTVTCRTRSVSSGLQGGSVTPTRRPGEEPRGTGAVRHLPEGPPRGGR